MIRGKGRVIVYAVVVFFVIVASVVDIAWADTPSPLMRFPNASATSIAFVSHGTVWITPLAGGTAKPLTNDPGIALAPRFSPDGQWIAYTARHAGAYDVFVVPAAGGHPRRLTFDAPRLLGENLVVTWTPDGRRIVFLSKRQSPMYRIDRAYSVPVEGGLPQQLPLNRSGLLSYGPDGHTIAFNRFFRNFDSRKRYVGGQAQNVSTYDFSTSRLIRITDWKGTDTCPMWFRHKIYFLSDRGPHFRANIWVRDLDHGSLRQITHFMNYDVDYPSLGARTITFQQGGRLWAIDLPSDRLHEIIVVVPDDKARTGRRTRPVGRWVRTIDATGGIDYALSPNGRTTFVSARGDIFALPSTGPAVNLTDTANVDEDHPSVSQDGHTIAYTIQEDGEQQMALRPSAGGPERIITRFKLGARYAAVWSRGGDWLAVPDANHALWLVRTDGAASRLVAQDPFAEIRDPCFSPDGRWLAYSATRPNGSRAIHLYQIASAQNVTLGSPMNSDRLPVFSADGRLLIFVSQRNEQPFVSDRDETTIATVNSDGLYAATLDPTDPSPLAGYQDQMAFRTGPLRIDLEGVMSRAVKLPVTPTTINALEVRGSSVFYEANGLRLITGNLPGTSGALHAFDLRDLTDRVIAAGMSGHSLSADGTHVGFQRDGVWQIMQTGAGPYNITTLDLSTVRATVDPRMEWTEMFEKAWRLDRDVFFSAVHNGDDWQAVHNAYARLLPRLGSEQDFLYLLGEMQGELASSHTFILDGDDGDPRTILPTQALGADFTLDPSTGLYQLAHIYVGDNTRTDYRSPLLAPGLDVRAGDYLLAIDGQTLRAPADPDAVLAERRGPLTLTFARTAAGPPHTARVFPVESELSLRHFDWIEHARETVGRLSGGRLGYVFLSDFDATGSEDFARQFYPQRDKAGLIIDVRWNRGGFTSQAVLDVLRRLKAGVFVNREGALMPLPVSPPPILVTLINYGTASDGDQFAFFFRRFGLGPLVGTRTWGGVQGINHPWSLMDGTAITIPKDSLADLDRHWIIENTGVSADIQTDDRPDEITTGVDSQLNEAVAIALRRLERSRSRPVKAPAALPAYPPGGNVPPASFGLSGRP